MLRQLCAFSAVVAMGAVLSVPAMASEITGSYDVSGTLHYTDDNGTKSFYTTPSPAQHSLAAFSTQSTSSTSNTLNLSSDFVYNGSITPAVFAANFGGQNGVLTLTSLNSVVNGPTAMEVVLSGTFSQAGYADKFATVSFLLNSDYMGNNVDLMKFSGIARLGPAVTPEPASLALLGTGMLALAGAGLMRRRMTMRDASGAQIA